jgi:hypothetical protein
MGLPSKPDALENKHEPTDAVVRDPSYPDRARIDSDVRAFLRPASSPWIVFDRDSRVDDFARSALRVGAVFASSPSFREEVKSSVDVSAPIDTPIAALGPMITEKTRATAFAPRGAAVLTPAMSSVLTGGMFPKDVGPTEPAVEPSSLVVASDVNSESAVELDDANAFAGREKIESDPFAVPGLVPNRSRALWMAGACGGVLAIVAVTSLAVARPSHASVAKATRSIVTTQTIEKKAEPVQAAQPQPALAAPAPVVEPAAAATEPSTSTSTSSSSSSSSETGKMSSDPKKRFGRLTIKADGKTKNVWFDGKRMLGTGTRSFMVFCGMHTVAVNEKADAKDIEVPCNGEFVAQAK